ncbi:hypothetical protein [Streptomyces abikoensis]|uniref:hypothetical protein n=1 Tax=Streptomyces abikoensis TaxID=97398 RepID=UPI0036AE41FD
MSIPHFTGNVDALVGDIASLAKDASDIRATGTDTHASFQGLSAHYEAPEAGQLLHSTLPVRERAAHFADELNKVKAALSEYAAEVRPIVKELDRLREQAVAFRASIGNDDKWLKNKSKTDENAHLIQAVTAAQERFHAAERNAFNKITGLFDKSLRLVEDDGTHKKGMYGYDPKAAAKAEKTPWGNVEKREYEGAEWLWHQAVDGPTDFVKGFFIDGTWAQIRGLGTLVGVDGMEKSKEALKNMALLAFVSNYVPVAEVARYLPGSWLPKVGREYKTAVNNGSKGLVAWDEWGKNPSRASGTLAFNVLTILTPVGEATAATKAGVTAKAVTTAAKVVEVIDPATYAVKGARLGLKAAKPAILKVGDLAAELKQSLGKLPDHTPTPAGESLKYAAADGKALLLDSKGNLHAPESAEHHPLAKPRKDPHKHDLTGNHELAQVNQRVLAHVGADGTGHGLPMHNSGGHGSSGSAGHTTSSSGTSGHVPSQTGHSSGENTTDPTHGSHSNGHGHPSTTVAPHASSHETSGHHATDDSGSSEPEKTDATQPYDTPIDPEVVEERIRQLDDQQGGEGHAPGRHLRPNADILTKRLGEPVYDANGKPKVYGPNAESPGLLKSQNNIDPLTGTTVDGVTGGAHRVGAFATRFDRAEDMVRADAHFREWMRENGGEPPKNSLPISDILGPEGHARFTGFYRNPANLDEFLPVDFQGGTIKAIYDFVDGEYHLKTMYPNPAPGRHP